MSDAVHSSNERNASLLQIGIQPPLKILFNDHAIIVVNKPSGQLVYGPTPGLPSSLADQVKEFIRDEKQKTANVFLGIVHRLDRPVSGVVVFARNSKFAGRMSEQFAGRDVTKRYVAIVTRTEIEEAGEMVDLLPKIGAEDAAVSAPQECRLNYQVLMKSPNFMLVGIDLLSGRRHQIRRQFSKRGMPIMGDREYGGSMLSFESINIDQRFLPMALHAYELQFSHPLSFEKMTMRAVLPKYWVKLLHDAELTSMSLEIEVDGGKP